MNEQELLSYEIIQEVEAEYREAFDNIDILPFLIYLVNEEYQTRIPYGEAKSITYDEINLIMNDFDEELSKYDRYEYKNRLINHKRLQEEEYEYSIQDSKGVKKAESIKDYLELYYNDFLVSLKEDLFERIDRELNSSSSLQK